MKLLVAIHDVSPAHDQAVQQMWRYCTSLGFQPALLVVPNWHGEWPIADSNGNTYQAYRDHFKWEIGLTVRDWRYNVRLANIDVTLLNGASAANIINGLIRGLYRMPTTGPAMSGVQTSDAPTIAGQMGRTAIYCNRVVRTYLDLQAMNKTNVLLQMREFDGHVVTTFRGVPIRTVDAILNTEARIT